MVRRCAVPGMGPILHSLLDANAASTRRRPCGGPPEQRLVLILAMQALKRQTSAVCVCVYVCQVCVTNTVLAARLKACACKPDELPSEDGAPSRSQPRGKSKAACRPSLARTRLGGTRGSPDEFSSLATVGQSTKREPNVVTLWRIAWSDIGWQRPCSA